MERLSDSYDVSSFENHRPYVVYVFFVHGGHLEMRIADDSSCAVYHVLLTEKVTDVFACCASSYPWLCNNRRHWNHPRDACPNGSLSPRYVLCLSVGHVPACYPNRVHHGRVFRLFSFVRQRQLLLHEPSALSAPSRLSPSLFPVQPAPAP